MTRLEREVQEQCDALVKSVSPDSVSITWFDNIHPHAPMLSEAYVASMYERSLMRRGFLVKKEGESANYKLLLAMTPSKRSLLILSTLSNIDSVVATRESYYVNGSEKWNKDLCSYRIRTKTRIPIGSRP